MTQQSKAPAVNQEFLVGLQLESDTIYPLPGAWGRPTFDDPRIKDWAKSDKVCYYEHVATVQHLPSKTFYVAFRETMQAFLTRQQDMSKYPKWLIDTKEKQQERQIHIYAVYKHPKAVVNMKSHEDWCMPIKDDAIFNAISQFLVASKVIDAGILKKSKG
jgi:hypothetical protein